MKHAEEGPDFLCIGPEKTGTTWLYKNLKKHPKVFLPKKELRYFWAQVYLPNETIIKRITSSHWHYRDLRRYFKRRLWFYINALGRMQLRHICAASWDFMSVGTYANGSNAKIVVSDVVDFNFEMSPAAMFSN